MQFKGKQKNKKKKPSKTFPELFLSTAKSSKNFVQCLAFCLSC